MDLMSIDMDKIVNAHNNEEDTGRTESKLASSGDESDISLSDEEDTPVAAPVVVSHHFIVNESIPVHVPQHHVPNHLMQKEKDAMRKRALEMRKKVHDALNSATVVDNILSQVSVRSIQAVVIFFTVFLAVARTYGQTQYITPLFIIGVLIAYGINKFVLREVFFMHNDFNMGWNYSLSLAGQIVVQALMLVALAFTFEIVKQNSSIHAKDAFMELIVSLLIWATIVGFIMKCTHFISEFWRVHTFLLSEARKEKSC